MAVSVDWGTQVISIPQSYLTPISGNLYELDTDELRLDLKALEASEEGMAFPDTHRHVTETVLGGVTYARFIEIINGYTVTFEDGQYRVRFTGSNNNISDVANLNQVSLLPQNSAGLIRVEDVAAADIAAAVLEKVVNDHIGVAGSLAEAIAIIRGGRLWHVLDGGSGTANVTLDAKSLMLSGRLRIFATAVAAAAATMGAADGADGEIASTTFTTAAAVAGAIDNMRVS